MNRNPARGSSLLRAYWIVAGLAMLVVMLLIASVLHWGQAIEPAEAAYAAIAQEAGCTAGSAPGTAGRHRLHTPEGVPYVVVTPTNYQATHKHPLLMVYAPAGFTAGLSERFAGLTHVATARGFVVAFVSSGPPLRVETLRPLAAVPAAVAARWCIDPQRVYATGHSDGGTVSTALAALPEFRGTVRAIVASGAGWSGADFIGRDCPPPLPVMILHGADDTHFPGFGRDAARWWSACNRCEGESAPDTDGCRRYRGCAAETLYCETPRSHWRWAADAGKAVDFLARQDVAGRAQ